ncbi:MAG TPA: type II secretion system F family protein [Anaerohalosphaeraceae bacterium]|nr:type II secretion system F family protein [Anaerohalosphaeraceae bacterium]HQG04971.1 type II secretion system F family protein [Anaerohalosphaeraceae bacterium]HQI07886.1 type II secretion system F family protein [Anaerohalosphaeraceae bacterium]HQJ68247.1 type II secretion system F family protein [Anaerohalosphaeraceae bacterium]
MIRFSYKAVSKEGKPAAGIIEAVDRKSAIALLAQRGQFALELEETSAAAPAAAAVQESRPLFVSGRIASRDILMVTEQITTALRAGLPVLQALEIVAQQQNKPPVRRILEELAQAVRSGHSLSEAMAEYPTVFPTLYRSMVEVGETGGILEETMQQLVRLLSREHKVQSSFRNASAYPVFVLTVGLISITVILVWILPQLIEALGTDLTALPLPTRMLMGMSHFLLYYGWLLAAAVAAAVYFFLRWKRTNSGLLQWDTFKLKVPLLGSVLRTLSVGRFARTLGSLTKCGIPILEALQVVRDTLGNEVLARQIDHVCEEVKAGSDLARPLGQSGLFDPLLVQIVSIGEQTGKLDEMLLQAADTFDEQADSVLQRYMSLVPAILILLLAAIIFFLIAATLLPVIGMDLSVFSG